MADSASTQDNDHEEPMSPDIFADYEDAKFSPKTPNQDEETDQVSPIRELDQIDDISEWKGISMDDINKGLGPFGYHQHPSIRPSEQHTVLFKLPIPNRGPPKPYPSQLVDKWSVEFVRMPNSQNCLYPIEQDNKPKEFQIRWEIIQTALLQNFISIAQLEAAIFSYNNKYAARWNFNALYHFFTEVMDEEETKIFFDNLLPKMIQLALQLPTLITGPIPLLKQHKNASLSLSQLQVASLLANAFFCTFPRRNTTNPHSEYGSYPYINFNGLFSAYREDRPNRSASVVEKLKCLFHYFRRVTTSAPEGTITIQRRYIPKEDYPVWDKLNEELPPLHITSKGTIETEGAGLLQIDFANKFIGGGVLYWGCVQEEIRFVICPELIVTMLVAEVLDDTEALIITGVERYSRYQGYSNSFKWIGNFTDETPRDTSGRRKTSIAAIDALYFTEANQQFNMKNITRELNKAYVGFSSSEMPKSELSAIATGNWGCGAFRGNPKLKILIQLMAAAVAGRSLAYFTFGDKNLRDSVADIYWHLINHKIDVGRLYTLLRAYENEPTTNHSDFYRFLYNRAKIKPLTNYFPIIPRKKKNTTVLKKKDISSDNSVNQLIVRQTFPKLQKSILSNKVEKKKIQKLLDSNYEEKNDEPSKPDVIRSEVIIKKKPSLWDIFAEKESEKDKIAVKPSEKLSLGLELLKNSTNNFNCSTNIIEDDNGIEIISKDPKELDMKLTTSNENDNEIKTHAIKSTNELINNNDNDNKINLSINNEQKLTCKLNNSQISRQKKINDFFTPKK